MTKNVFTLKLFSKLIYNTYRRRFDLIGKITKLLHRGLGVKFQCLVHTRIQNRFLLTYSLSWHKNIQSYLYPAIQIKTSCSQKNHQKNALLLYKLEADGLSTIIYPKKNQTSPIGMNNRHHFFMFKADIRMLFPWTQNCTPLNHCKKVVYKV